MARTAVGRGPHVVRMLTQRAGNSSAHIAVVLLSDRLSLMCVPAGGAHGKHMIHDCPLDLKHIGMRGKALKQYYNGLHFFLLIKLILI